MTGHTIFIIQEDRAAFRGLNAPCELAQYLLTVTACFSQCAGGGAFTQVNFILSWPVTTIGIILATIVISNRRRTPARNKSIFSSLGTGSANAQVRIERAKPCSPLTCIFCAVSRNLKSLLHPLAQPSRAQPYRPIASQQWIEVCRCRLSGAACATTCAMTAPT